MLVADFDRITAERDALQQRLTETDQRADDLQIQLDELEQRHRAEFEACKAAERRVDALEKALKFYAEGEHYHFESGNWGTVSSEPLNILWCGDEPDFIEDGMVARAALNPTTWMCTPCKLEQPTDRSCDVCDGPTTPTIQPQGGPVAMVRTHGSECWEEITGESLEMCKAEPEEYEVRMLYARPAEQPAPVAVASREESIYWLKRIDGIGQNRAELIYSMGFRRHTEVPQS